MKSVGAKERTNLSAGIRMGAGKVSTWLGFEVLLIPGLTELVQ